MRTAGVVADHSSNGAVLMCRRIGSEGKVVLFGGVAQLIVDQPGFDPSVVFLRVQLEQTVEVLGEVQHDRDIAGLSSEARSSAAPQDGNAMLAADCDRFDDVLDRARDDSANGDLTIVREVGGVDRARSRIEAHLGVGSPAKLVDELRRKRW